jgi:hypothetical protein
MAFPLGLRFKAIIARFSAKQTKFSTAGTRSMSLPATRLTTRVELFYCRGSRFGADAPEASPWSSSPSKSAAQNRKQCEKCDFMHVEGATLRGDCQLPLEGR